MITPEVAERQGITADLRYLQREFLIEALDGAIYQAEGAIRFAERGYPDEYVHAAVRRAAELFRTAVEVSNDLNAESKRAAAAAKGRVAT